MFWNSSSSYDDFKLSVVDRDRIQLKSSNSYGIFIKILECVMEQRANSGFLYRLLLPRQHNVDNVFYIPLYHRSNNGCDEKCNHIAY